MATEASADERLLSDGGLAYYRRYSQSSAVTRLLLDHIDALTKRLEGLEAETQRLTHQLAHERDYRARVASVDPFEDGDLYIACRFCGSGAHVGDEVQIVHHVDCLWEEASVWEQRESVAALHEEVDDVREVVRSIVELIETLALADPGSAAIYAAVVRSIQTSERLQTRAEAV